MRSASAKNGIANAVTCAGRSTTKRALRGAVMAWHWSVPAFRGGMPGEPIWSLQWRAHSASRRRAPWRSKSRWPRQRWRPQGARCAVVCLFQIAAMLYRGVANDSHGGAAPCAQASSPRSSPAFSWFPSPRRIECRRLRPTSLPTLRRKRPTNSRKGAAMRSGDRSSRSCAARRSCCAPKPWATTCVSRARSVLASMKW